MISSTISRLLLRGYNTARPFFDEGDGDDFWVALKGSKDRIKRIQVKSAFLKTTEIKGSNNIVSIHVPQSILDGTVDIVAIGLWDWNNTYIGIFDSGDIRDMLKKQLGYPDNRKKSSHTPHFGFRFTLSIIGNVPRINCGPKKCEVDVTHHFVIENGRWDELFPTRFPKSTDATAPKKREIFSQIFELASGDSRWGPNSKCQTRCTICQRRTPMGRGGTRFFCGFFDITQGVSHGCL